MGGDACSGTGVAPANTSDRNAPKMTYQISFPQTSPVVSFAGAIDWGVGFATNSGSDEPAPDELGGFDQ